MRKNLLILISILFLASILRLLWLDRIPHSINGDQLHYLLSVKSFFLTGKDLGQTTNLLNILLFNYPPNELVQAELPYFLELLTVGLLGFSLFGSFLPNAILGLGTVVLIYLITKKLINEQAALFSGFIAAVNPWLISIGRTSYEMMPATFFYLCSFYILLIAKGWKILWALPLFILAFYAYIATKLIALPIALVLVLYTYFFIHKKRFGRQYLILLASFTLFILFYAFQLTNAPSTSRLSEIATPSSPHIAEQVDAIRKTSIAHPLLSLFENKLSVFLSIILTNTFNVFSPDYLFLHGDYFASLGKYGLFYPLDFIFLLIGAGLLFIRNKKLLAFLTAVILIAIVPQIVHAKDGTNFTPHITLLFPFFIIFMAVGAQQMVTFSKKRIQQIIAGVVIFFYIFSVGNFLNMYFFQMPLQSGFFNFPNRLLAKYITVSKKQDQKILIYTTNQEGVFKEYIFYNNLYNKNNAAAISETLKEKIHTLGNVQILPCDKSRKSLSKDLTIVNTQCGMSFDKPHLAIPLLSDSGAVFHIYNDTTCSKHTLTSYVSNIKISDFSVETLSEQQFCSKFIISQ